MYCSNFITLQTFFFFGGRGDFFFHQCNYQHKFHTKTHLAFLKFLKWEIGVCKSLDFSFLSLNISIIYSVFSFSFYSVYQQKIRYHTTLIMDTFRDHSPKLIMLRIKIITYFLYYIIYIIQFYIGKIIVYICVIINKY